MRAHATLCHARGYCGPFVNRQLYDSFVEPFWHGMGECALCRTTACVAEEEAKQSVALTRRAHAR